MTNYNPNAHYTVRTEDVEYRRDGDQSWLARIYQPEGTGPFPVLLDVHGGAWNGGDRLQNQVIDGAFAASGLLVVAVDFRLAPDHPYPAQVQDVNFATRWLKTHAAEFHGDPATLGGLGSSSGGHTVTLSALRPHDPRYAAHPLAAAGVDASLRYVVACWPVLDPYSRYLFAQTTPDAAEGFGGAELKLKQTLSYFLDEPAMHEGNPQEILERGDAQALPPVLIVIGTEDMNLPLTIPQRFAPAYRALGGSAAVAWFPGMPHGFANRDYPESLLAIEAIKAFIAVQLSAPVGAAAAGKIGQAG